MHGRSLGESRMPAVSESDSRSEYPTVPRRKTFEEVCIFEVTGLSEENDAVSGRRSSRSSLSVQTCWWIRRERWPRVLRSRSELLLQVRVSPSRVISFSTACQLSMFVLYFPRPPFISESSRTTPCPGFVHFSYFYWDIILFFFVLRPLFNGVGLITAGHRRTTARHYRTTAWQQQESSRTPNVDEILQCTKWYLLQYVGESKAQTSGQ